MHKHTAGPANEAGSERQPVLGKEGQSGLIFMEIKSKRNWTTHTEEEPRASWGCNRKLDILNYLY